MFKKSEHLYRISWTVIKIVGLVINFSKVDDFCIVLLEMRYFPHFFHNSFHLSKRVSF